MKIFLSHSSTDKDIVRKVYDELGPGICHYDVATFNPSGYLPEEIHSALAESTHFVLFASEKSLSSEWVNGELKIAFINWVRTKTRSAMVFLLRGGKRPDVPDWLQNYVITEHPSPAHIAYRILSEYDKEEASESTSPPPYRTDELKRIEKEFLVDAARMPACLMVCGVDGMGRKELVNEFFSRQFRHVCRRKIHIHADNFDSDVDLYKSLKGIFSLTTARDLSEQISSYSAKLLVDRVYELAELITQVCGGAQTIIFDAGDSVFNDSGDFNQWIEHLILKLPSRSYPLLCIVSSRKPSYVGLSLSNKLVVANLEPLPDGDSSLIFHWWTNRLSIEISPSVSAEILDQVSGNPALIKNAAHLLKGLQDRTDIHAIKRYVLADLEKSSARVAKDIAKDDLSKLLLAFVADCGQISQADLSATISQACDNTVDDIATCHKKLLSFGLLQTDSVSTRVPNFIRRHCQSLGRISSIEASLKKCWELLAESIENVSFDDETSTTLLNEACILKLKQGVNSITGIDSLVLPSQCLKIAKQMYDRRDYDHAHSLSARAFMSRLALTDDGAIEALRYSGMSAARMNRSDLLAQALSNFDEYSGNQRARRISEFVRGFDFRLAGRFDEALSHMQKAVNTKGPNDVHVIRELASLYLSTNQSDKAKKFIVSAKHRARSNSFISELQIRIELSFGKGYVVHNSYSILELISELQSLDTQRGLRCLVEYLLVRGDVAEARTEFEKLRERFGVGTVARILEAKILMAEKKFSVALNILVDLKSKVIAAKTSQRQSTLPIIADLIVQAASGVSTADAISEFDRNQKHMPAMMRERSRQELIGHIAFTMHTPSHAEKTILKI